MSWVYTSRARTQLLSPHLKFATWTRLLLCSKTNTPKKLLSMDNDQGEGFPGRTQNNFDPFWSQRVRFPFTISHQYPIAHILQAPHLEMLGGNQWENRLSTGQRESRGYDANQIMPQEIVVQQPLTPPSHPASYTIPANANQVHALLHGAHRGGLYNTSAPQPPHGNHHTPGGHPACNLWGTHNTVVSHGLPLVVRQAAQESTGGPMISLQPPAHPPPTGFNDVVPIQKRRVRGWRCPVLNCKSSPGRPQDQRRHLLTHFPRWICCTVPDCSWRGDRFSAFKSHWGRDHPSSSQVPHEDQCKIYDPQQLVKEIVEGTLCIRAAQKYTIFMVQKKASELGKPELCDNLWGRRREKLRKAY